MKTIELFNSSDNFEHSVAYRVYRVARVLRIHLIRLLESVGYSLSPEQFFCLAKIQENQGASQRELADPRFADYPNITRLVDSLIQQGFVERRPVPDDRRRHAVWLTESGQVAIDTLMAEVVSERRLMYAGVDPEMLQKAVALLDTLEERAYSRTRVLEEGGRQE